MEMNGAFVSGTTGVTHTHAGQHHQVQLTQIEPVTRSTSKLQSFR